MSSNWQEIVRAKKDSIDQLIPKEWRIADHIKSNYRDDKPASVIGIHNQLGILNEREVEITESYNAKELLEKVADRKFTSLEVTTAFCKRAAIATQLTNCCTELLFNEALERAKWLDDYLESNGEVLGPLHGLPVSLKDSHCVKGFDSTIGYVSFIGNHSDITENCAIYKLLLELGAVVHVKTNVPTTLLSADSSNNVFGRTLNPNNLTLTAGGSSGGEASLIKQRGSLIGIGTDIGGSIRIPALACGIYGFKPSSFRFPTQGNIPPTRLNFASPINLVAGPLSYDVETLSLFMDLISNHPNVGKYDPDFYLMPWNDDVQLPKKIKIGVIFECGSLPLQPPMKRIMKDAVKKLEQSSMFDVIFLDDFPSYDDAWKITFRYFMSDPAGEALPNILKSGEPPMQILSSLQEYNKKHLPIPETFDDFHHLGQERLDIKKKWINLINDLGLDVIMSPGSPYTAPQHDKIVNPAYTSLWNLIDFPSLIIPFGKADKNIDNDDPAIEYKHGAPEIYEKEIYDGSSGHVQLSYRTLQDEKVLKIGHLVDKILHNLE